MNINVLILIWFCFFHLVLQTKKFNKYISSDDVVCIICNENLKKQYEEAIDNFTELEIQYPYSPWASRGQLMIGFAHYSANEYDEAILNLSKFVELNPNHKLIPYAIYLKPILILKEFQT